ncbi:SDR family NAD(P)-dependent oxidoreductase [Mucilaginibacter gilvus]|uniref:SDR family oxidoreductase n=1 Tax=Mucilaginibacter gilvus TaxID=2305909 RepID=A0A3S3XA82_9SPHI|nr:SDR family oxidoreductase [Mucilaginibacter gilvus]RWY54014.1 SDR family oxidoreductase [Mucilaginibacter gilvus]
MNFNGKNILVIGGSSGIGLSLIKLLAANGATVYNISRTSSPEWPVGVNHLTLDILQDCSPAAAFLPEQLHGLVYSVGSITLKPFARLTEDDFLNDYRVNVTGAVKIIQQALKPLKVAQSASVVLISSVAAKTGMSFHGSIAAAKSAVEGLALSLAAELSPNRIRVNVIAPSLTDTPLAQTFLSTPERKEASNKRHPLGKYGVPEDISSAIAFLLADETAWMTGQVIGIDGGLGKLKAG